MRKKLSEWIPNLWSNWISTVGVIITTVAGCSLLFGLVYHFASPYSNPYATAALLLVAPMIFFVGLILIPLGHFIERWRGKKAPEDDSTSLRAAVGRALSNKVVRRHALIIGALTLFNIVLFGFVGQQATHYMDSPAFCGTTCHVMQPQHDAYVRSPHSRVPCVQCHIGPGAEWAVKAKVDGIRQVWAVATGSYRRPIPSPVHELRPARDTCEQCHWPSKFHGNSVRHRVHYESSKNNTPVVNVFALRVGGQNPRTKEYEGIHWHVSSDYRVEYEAHDEKRERIGRVRVYKGDDLLREYLAPKLDPDDEESKPLGEVHETRSMDCVDCHNRPAHKFDGKPEFAVDEALTHGDLDVTMPWIRKMSIAVLKNDERKRDGVESALRADLAAAYETDPKAETPSAEALDKAAAVLADLYTRNIYPDMKIGWDTYPEHTGHRGDDADRRGCFRCHDNKHRTSDDKPLSQSCTLCHTILADEESVSDMPKDLLRLLPKHLVKNLAKVPSDDDDDDDDEDDDDDDDDDDEDDDEDEDEKPKATPDAKEKPAVEKDAGDETATDKPDAQEKPAAGTDTTDEPSTDTSDEPAEKTAEDKAGDKPTKGVQESSEPAAPPTTPEGTEGARK